MAADPARIKCVEFQAAIPALISSWADLQNHPHALQCLVCSALLRDLERIGNDSRRFLSGVRNPDEIGTANQAAAPPLGR